MFAFTNRKPITAICNKRGKGLRSKSEIAFVYLWLPLSDRTYGTKDNVRQKGRITFYLRPVFFLASECSEFDFRGVFWIWIWNPRWFEFKDPQQIEVNPNLINYIPNDNLIKTFFLTLLNCKYRETIEVAFISK